MNSTSNKPSLIHYLEPTDATFHLKLSMSGQKGSGVKETHFPFSVINESDPLALILEASILSDADAKIESVFLLIQKDEYRLTKDELWPLSNRDVERAWQNLFSILKTPNQGDAIVLKDQVGANDKLLPWNPLFYCQHRQIFFQPSCPRCGSLLAMCYDDDLLIGLGLQPYSASLKRYLFCQNCLNTLGESDFYVHSLEIADSEILKDKRALIIGFGQLVREGSCHTKFPCNECANFQECYETEYLAFSRIVSVSFYPFFMLALRAQSIHALEFLPLLGGATFGDLASQLQANGQWGRLKCLRDFEEKNSANTLFFFDNEERFFLEVLYLKLSFLGELAQIVFSGLGTFRYPDLALSIDRIWVKVAEQSGMLPFLWNFKLKLIGIGVDYPQTPFLSKLPPSYGLYFLGSIWFYVLLGNKRQGVEKIFKELAHFIEDLTPKTDSVPESTPTILSQNADIFSPENIFWNPEQKEVNAAWETLWKKGLDLGFLLIKSSRGEISQWSETDFWQEFEKVRKELKDALLMPQAGAVSTPRTDDNKPIHEILERITRKWQSVSQAIYPETEVAAVEIPPDALKGDKIDAGLPEDRIMKETVILSPEDFKEGPPSRKAKDDRFTETLGVTPEAVEKIETPEPTSQTEEDLPRTVILSHDISGRDTSPLLESRENDIPETIVITPQDSSGSYVDHDRKTSKKESDFEKVKQATSKAKKESVFEQALANTEDKNDDLPETVILNLDKAKDE